MSRFAPGIPGRTMAGFALGVAVLLSSAPALWAQPGPPGRRPPFGGGKGPGAEPAKGGDEVKKLEAEIAKLRDQIRAATDRLSKAKASASKSRGRPGPKAGPGPRPGLGPWGDFRRFGGPGAGRGPRGDFGRFGGPPHRGGPGPWGWHRPPGTEARKGGAKNTDIEKALDRIAKELKDLRKQLQKK